MNHETTTQPQRLSDPANCSPKERAYTRGWRDAKAGRLPQEDTPLYLLGHRDCVATLRDCRRFGGNEVRGVE